jgi:hypothetical protein
MNKKCSLFRHFPLVTVSQKAKTKKVASNLSNLIREMASICEFDGEVSLTISITNEFRWWKHQNIVTLTDSGQSESHISAMGGGFCT